MEKNRVSFVKRGIQYVHNDCEVTDLGRSTVHAGGLRLCLAHPFRPKSVWQCGTCSATHHLCPAGSHGNKWYSEPMISMDLAPILQLIAPLSLYKSYQGSKFALAPALIGERLLLLHSMCFVVEGVCQQRQQILNWFSANQVQWCIHIHWWYVGVQLDTAQLPFCFWRSFIDAGCIIMCPTSMAVLQNSNYFLQKKSLDLVN